MCGCRRFGASGAYHGHVPAQPDDWRRMGQERSLIPGTRFAWKNYQAPRADWDHDHCSMCQDKFMDPAGGDLSPPRPAVSAECGMTVQRYAAMPENFGSGLRRR